MSFAKIYIYRYISWPLDGVSISHPAPWPRAGNAPKKCTRRSAGKKKRYFYWGWPWQKCIHKCELLADAAPQSVAKKAERSSAERWNLSIPAGSLLIILLIQSRLLINNPMLLRNLGDMLHACLNSMVLGMMLRILVVFGVGRPQQLCKRATRRTLLRWCMSVNILKRRLSHLWEHFGWCSWHEYGDCCWCFFWFLSVDNLDHSQCGCVGHEQ